MSDGRLVQLQQKIATRVDLHWDNRPVSIVGGVDVHPVADKAVAVLVLLAFPRLDHVADVLAYGAFPHPYRPGLLSFREAPLLLRVLARSDARPDVLFCDGHGIAHPRRLGLASHVGVVWGIPTIGCAKSRLYGEASEPGLLRGATSSLKAKSGEQIGTVLRTRSYTRPVYVSPGHLIDVRTATRLTLKCTKRYRIPEPLRLAHMVAKRTARAYRETNRAG